MKEKVNHYCHKWGLSNTEVIAKTPTSHVLKVIRNQENVVLKCFTDLGLKYETHSSKYLVPAKGYQVVEIKEFDDGAQLLEFIDGEDLESFLVKNSDEEATKILARTLQKIHSIELEDYAEFSDLKKQYQSLFNKVSENPDEVIYLKGQEVAEKLLDTEKEKVLLHGDIHHQNIIHSTKRGWVVIDPQSFYGERTYDVANSFFNPYVLKPEDIDNKLIMKRVDILSKKMNLDPKRILQFAFAHGALSACWAEECGNSPERRLAIAKTIYKILK